jgi:hypothetical protein
MRTAAACAFATGLLAGAVAPAQTRDGNEVVLTAASVNVAEPGQPARFRIFRWSTDEERQALVAALSAPPPAPRGAPPPAGRGGRGGGRGRGRGAAAAPLTPIQRLTAAIGRTPTIGFIWTNDVTGYAIKYAHRVVQPDGSQRIILATDRRFGTHTAAWQPAVRTGLTDYEFTVFEIRLSPDGTGEARTSLTTRVVVDEAAGSIALENYATAPALLKQVRVVRSQS